MPLKKNTPVKTYIKDFEKSKAPQFKGKSKEKRREMAVAAALQAQGKKKSTKESLTEAPSSKAIQLAGHLAQAILKVDESLSYQDLAAAVAKVLVDDYGDHLYRPFVIELMKELLESERGLNEVEAPETFVGKGAKLAVRQHPNYKTLPSQAKKQVEKDLDSGQVVNLQEDNDFFENTRDDDRFVDVSGPSVEAAVLDMLNEFEDRLKDIPEEKRDQALGAIKDYWIQYIEQWNPNLITPGRAPFAESKKKLNEGREYDWEGSMARSQLVSIIKNAKNLYDCIDDKTQLQSWVQSKLTKAEDYITAVRTYLDGESVSNTTPLYHNNEAVHDEEGSVLRIGDVVKGADGGIYQIAYSYSEGKPFVTPFDLKKRKPTNLRTRHYFDTMNEGEMSPTKRMIRVMEYSATKGGFVK